MSSEDTDSPITVVAIGGNALLRPGEVGEAAQLTRTAESVAGQLIPLVRAGHRLLVVHGNGPQVGIELTRSEEASTKVPPFRLDLCVANTQGSIGALLETAFRNALNEDLMSDHPLATMTTQVVVDPNDPAFKHPSKPIGLFYSQYRADQLRDDLLARGWDIVEDSGRGFRPIVPSPHPLEVLNSGAVQTLLERGVLVIAGGGGGVPVVREPTGRLRRIEAVVDKDRTAALLARDVGASMVLFVTGVPWVELNFGTPFSRRLGTVTYQEMEQHLHGGQFPAGSMGPKVEAAISVAQAGGTALITSADSLQSALAGEAGTRIIG